MIDGVLYGSTSFSQVFALDAATGEAIWVSDPKSFTPQRDNLSTIVSNFT